jgi:hypothetical protein
MSKTELLCNDIVESVIIKLSLAKRWVSCDNFGSRSFEIKYCAGKQYFLCVICITKCHHSVSMGIILVMSKYTIKDSMYLEKREQLTI